MPPSNDLRDELHALKRDLARILEAANARIAQDSKTRIDDVAEQIKATLVDLGDTLLHEEEHVEKLVTQRPIAALASALAVGVVIGLLLRRS